MTRPLRIVVTGLIAQHPHLGGVAWDYVQYPAGLARLGYDVYYFEDSGQWPYNVDGGRSGQDWIARDCTHNVSHLAEVMRRFGLGERWAYRFPLDGTWYGLHESRRRDVMETADLVLNISGTLEHPDRYRSAERLAYIDSDPVFTQVRLLAGPDALGLSAEDEREERKFRARVDAHDVYFTFGETLPRNLRGTGHDWRSTRQPVLLSEWHPVAPHSDAFTTVMSWTSYNPLVHAGRTYAQKDVELSRFVDLPRRIPQARLSVAVNPTSHSNWESATTNGETPAEILERNGWHVLDARRACRDLDGYRSFIESSAGEWSVAKNGYVVGRPGWFSCRSACYLAAGRPVVVQDTGFGDVLPIGTGVVAFETPDEAAAALEDVAGNYERHASAARELAEEFFDSDDVLDKLVNEAIGGPLAVTADATGA